MCPSEVFPMILCSAVSWTCFSGEAWWYTVVIWLSSLLSDRTVMFERNIEKLVHEGWRDRDRRVQASGVSHSRNKGLHHPCEGIERDGLTREGMQSAAHGVAFITRLYYFFIIISLDHLFSLFFQFSFSSLPLSSVLIPCLPSSHAVIFHFSLRLDQLRVVCKG